jgi:hypothetical protein
MKTERIKTVDGVTYVWCKNHQEYLECSNFYFRKKGILYDYMCKACVLEKNKRQRESKSIPKVAEKELSNMLLKACGYDPSSTISIHEQFLIKHDL